jgi:hypothetical protein
MVRAYLPSGTFGARTGTIATGTTDATATVTLLRRRSGDNGWEPTSPAVTATAYNDSKMSPPAGANVMLYLIHDGGRLWLVGWECS